MCVCVPVLLIYECVIVCPLQLLYSTVTSNVSQYASLNYTPVPLPLSEYQYTQTVTTSYFSVIQWSLTFAAMPGFVHANSNNLQ